MKQHHASSLAMRGAGFWRLVHASDPHDPETWDRGEVIDQGIFGNLITQYGDQYYAERSYDNALHLGATGMQLGTGTTATSKTGGGSAVVAYVSGSSSPFSVGFPAFSLESGSRRIRYRCGWGPGVASHAALAEVVLINQAIATDSGAPASATLSRARINPTLDKTDPDAILIVTWDHFLLGV